MHENPQRRGLPLDAAGPVTARPRAECAARGLPCVQRVECKQRALCAALGAPTGVCTQLHTSQRPGRALPAGRLPAAAAALQAHFMTDNNDKLLPNLKVLDFDDMPEISARCTTPSGARSCGATTAPSSLRRPRWTSCGRTSTRTLLCVHRLGLGRRTDVLVQQSAVLVASSKVPTAC